MPDKEATVHWLTKKGSYSGETFACNVWPMTYFFSKKKKDVICGNCKRTKVFKAT